MVLIATDRKDDQIKSFCLFRFCSFETAKENFDNTRLKEVTDYYKYSSDIVGPNLKIASEIIILKFTAKQGKYIKSLPLHHTQTILEEKDNSLTIKLKLHITHDFIMELLSYSN
ncbi:WYL domain-containing protein [Plebeiibacterium sediminum]|uniref:WYL domain-containing protein n=1 Tax=Plebeiibacterium sediminum TaxID=2992112 RepID=A0AAE3SHH5_9BACT|nr:WYL domain-containing protein [Plebeiobacterium sediminum]MCW3789598.1 WYL domain-containing protein [Plebeiobacterium sediminum]